MIKNALAQKEEGYDYILITDVYEQECLWIVEIMEGKIIFVPKMT